MCPLGQLQKSRQEAIMSPVLSLAPVCPSSNPCQSEPLRSESSRSASIWSWKENQLVGKKKVVGNSCTLLCQQLSCLPSHHGNCGTKPPTYDKKGTGNSLLQLLVENSQMWAGVSVAHVFGFWEWIFPLNAAYCPASWVLIRTVLVIVMTL
jgi:hypothetical protein